MLDKIPNGAMIPIPPANSLNKSKENYTTLGHIVRLPASLSAEDVQQLATTVAALVGCLSSSNNPLVSGATRLSTAPTAGSVLLVLLYQHGDKIFHFYIT